MFLEPAQFSGSCARSDNIFFNDHPHNDNVGVGTAGTHVAQQHSHGDLSKFGVTIGDVTSVFPCEACQVNIAMPNSGSTLLKAV